jgi:hypothetical protein
MKDIGRIPLDHQRIGCAIRQAFFSRSPRNPLFDIGSSRYALRNRAYWNEVVCAFYHYKRRSMIERNNIVESMFEYNICECLLHDVPVSYV